MRRSPRLAPTVFVIVASCLGCALAEGTPDVPPPAEPSARSLAVASDVGLMGETARAVALVLDDEASRRREVLEAHREGTSPDDLRGLGEKLRAVEEASRTELEALLTSEQWQALDAWRQERRARVGGELLVHRLRDRLALTPDQEDALVPVLAADLEARRAALAEGRSGGRGRGALRDLRTTMQEREEALAAEVAPILDDVQEQAFAAWRQEQREELRDRVREGRGARRDR